MASARRRKASLSDLRLEEKPSGSLVGNDDASSDDGQERVKLLAKSYREENLIDPYYVTGTAYQPPFSFKKRQVSKPPSWLEVKANQLFNLLRYYAAWLGFLLIALPRTLEKLPLLVFRLTEFIQPLARIISGIRMLNNTGFQQHGKWTFALSLLAGCAGIALGIAAFAAPFLGLVFLTANFANNASVSLWDIGLSLKNKYRGQWKKLHLQLAKKEKQFLKKLGAENEDFLNNFLKLRTLVAQQEKLRAEQEALETQQKTLQAKHETLQTQQKTLQAEQEALQKSLPAEQQKKCKAFLALEKHILKLKTQNRDLSADLATKIHNSFIIFLALAGATMLFFPPTSLAGAIILLITNTHGVFFGFDLTGRYKKIQDFLLPPPTLDEPQKLREKVTAQRSISSTAQVQKAWSSRSRSGDKTPSSDSGQYEETRSQPTSPSSIRLFETSPRQKEPPPSAKLHMDMGMSA